MLVLPGVRKIFSIGDVMGLHFGFVLETDYNIWIFLLLLSRVYTEPGPFLLFSWPSEEAWDIQEVRRGHILQYMSQFQKGR